MKKIVIILLCCASFVSAQQQTPEEKIVQKQLEAYNARNLEAFLETYSEDVIFYNFPNIVRIEGKDKIREVFASLFKNNPDLHCTVEDRIVAGDTVIDHEKILFHKGDQIRESVVMYKVHNNKITAVYFLKRL